jgi:parallel beta-helix repeat protein
MVSKIFFICLFYILVSIGFAGAATLDVGEGLNYTTIQSAILAANPGDIVSVSEGTYYENVIIKKNQIDLIGQNREKTIIDGRMGSSGIRIDESHNVRISGFTVRNSGGGGKEDGGVTLYRARDNTVSDLLVTDNSVGISIHTGSHNNIISGNEVILNKGNESKGIYIFASEGNRIFNNNIKDNPYGLFSDSGRKNYIYSNNFINNTMQAYDNSGMNTWDDGKNGNYWSDFKGNGLYKIEGRRAYDEYPRSGPVLIKFEIFPKSFEQQDPMSTPGLAGFIVAALIIGAFYVIGIIILRKRNKK